MKYPERIGVRLVSEEREKINRLISEGKFKDISSAIRAAIVLFLSREGQALADFKNQDA